VTTPLSGVLTRAEWPDPVFTGGTVSAWPVGWLDRLRAAGLLAEADPAESVACDACGRDHVERVVRVDGPGSVRALVRCPEAGFVPVPAGRLHRWVVRLPVLARLVASALGAGDVTERVPGRVWRLGKVRAGGRVWVGFVAVGLTRPDGASVVEGAPELRATNALVFVPFATPPRAVWSSDRAPVVVPLIDLLSLGVAGLAVDRPALDSAVTPATATLPKSPTRVFPTPAGTTWEQVHLTVEDHHVRVQVGEVVERFGFGEAGFEERRKTGVPDHAWRTLTLLAQYSGTLGSGDRVTTKKGEVKQVVSVLRGRLKALLGIEADPFHATAKGQPYRARFTVRLGSGTAFPTPPGAVWDDVSVTEVASGVFEASVGTTGRDVLFVPTDDSPRGRPEAAVTPDERRGRYTLADLGLVDADGSPKPAGDALVALLRSAGRLRGRAADPALLALGQALSTFFGLGEPPLDYDRPRREWVARFEARSAVPGPARNQ
jgi:hypothetical protein